MTISIRWRRRQRRKSKITFTYRPRSVTPVAIQTHVRVGTLTVALI
jgi:hypothetical protein